MSDHNEILWIDNFGNVLQGSEYIGYKDVADNKCFDYNDVEFPCPERSEPITQPSIASTKTYWWVLLIVFIVVVIFIGWFVNRKK